MIVDWNHIQLIGWYGSEGKAYFVPLEHNGCMVRVVVTGGRESEMPLLDIPVPKDMELHLIPEDKNPYEYAKERAGFYAVGFYVEEGFERR